MSQGHERSEWGRTAQLSFILAEIHRDRKQNDTPYTPGDFNPTLPKRKKAPPMMKGVGGLKALLGGRCRTRRVAVKGRAQA